MLNLSHLRPGITAAGLVVMSVATFHQPGINQLEHAMDGADVIAVRDDHGQIHTGRILVLDGTRSRGEILVITMDEGAGISTFRLAGIS